MFYRRAGKSINCYHANIIALVHCIFFLCFPIAPKKRKRVEEKLPIATQNVINLLASKFWKMQL